MCLLRLESWDAAALGLRSCELQGVSGKASADWLTQLLCIDGFSEKGIWLGKANKTDEHILGTKSGAPSLEASSEDRRKRDGTKLF